MKTDATKTIAASTTAPVYIAKARKQKKKVN